MIDVTIKLFGAFRKYGNGEEMTISVPENTQIQDLKTYLGNEIKAKHGDFDQNLINSSVFGNENEILKTDSVISKKCTLAVLPPVCGG